MKLFDVVLGSCILHAISCAATPSVETRSPGGSKSVIIQMFQWTWDRSVNSWCYAVDGDVVLSIAAECTNFIGPAGYGFVQGELDLKSRHRFRNLLAVSPPSEHIQGPQWWTDYQPVSYILTSKRGNRQQFQKYNCSLLLWSSLTFSIKHDLNVSFRWCQSHCWYA